MLLIPLGVTGERGLFVLTVLISFLCILAFGAFSDEQVMRRFAYDPSTWHVGRMLSSEFMHGSPSHLLGNLFFFIPFAASVERRTNSIAFLLFFLFIAIGESAAYHFASLHAEQPLPTIGLSGVVWGFMGLFLGIHPTVRLDCWFFFLVGAKRVQVPNWVFVLGFLVLEILSYRGEPNATVNYVAHFAGFGAGVLARVLAWPFVVFDTEPERRVQGGSRRPDRGTDRSPSP